MVLMFLASMFTVAFNVTPVKAVITSNVPISITTDFTLTDDYEFIGCDGFHIDADYVTLDLAGHTITGDGTHIGILLNGRTGVTVKNGTIENFEQGIWLLTSNSNVIKDNSIHVPFEGIWLDGSSDNIIEGNTAWGSTYGDGVGLSDSLGSYSGNVVRHNNCSNNVLGIFLFDGTDNIIENNTLSGNGNAIRVDAGYGGASNGNIIKGNICSGGWSAAIAAVNWRFPDEPWGSFSNIQVTCNDVINNRAGIYIAGEIYAGTTYPVDATAFAVNFNNIVGNELYGAKNLGTGTLDARCNWWGDVKGPGNETGSTGDSVYGNVDYTPWSDAQFPVVGDINNDCIVSITDIVIAATAFGSRPGDPNWNPIADLNGDGIVSIVDLVMIAVNFGKGCVIK